LADATLPSAGSKPLRWTTRLVLFALLWLVLVGTDPVSWIVGVPAVLLASYAAARLSTLVGADPRPLRLIAFVPFFVWESVLGGVDVARRVLAPRLRIDPALVSYRPRLKDPAAQVVFLDTISLLPGTLSADIRKGLVQIHALDSDQAMVAGLERLEARVARLFGEEVTGAPIVTVTSCAREDALALARAEAQAAAQEATASAGHDPRKSS
jgi:multicomponent Na+:H+ antiporter subunit E